jgi:hypothetical protein
MFCYEIRVVHNLAYESEDGTLTREQVIERAKAETINEQERWAAHDWDNAVVSEPKDDY